VARSRQIVLYVGLCVVLFALMAKASGNIADLDLWHEMALAREAWRAGHVPTHDSFAYTPTLPFIVHHEWGAGVVALAIWDHLGAGALMPWNFALAAGALWLAMDAARRRGAALGPIAFGAIAMSPLIAGGYQPVRAQAYGFLFFCGALWCAEQERAGGRWWIAPWLALFPLWVNLHASCVLGFAAFGLLWLERRTWRVSAALAGMAALLFVNPYGGAYITYLLRAVPKARPLIDEWHPAWTSEMFPLVAAGCVAFAYAAWRRRGDWAAVTLVLLVAAQAMLHRKMIPFFAFAWLAYVPAWLQKTPLWRDVSDGLGEYRKLLRPLAAVGIAGCTVYLVSTRPWTLRVPDRDARPSYPVGAVRFLKSGGFHGNLLTHFEQGAYVMWEVGPAVKVAVDSRYEVAYPDSTVEAAVAVYQTAEWQGFTRKYPADMILTQARFGGLESSLAAGGWKPVYSDTEWKLWRLDRPGGLSY
jgi:hypothetical protein